MTARLCCQPLTEDDFPEKPNPARMAGSKSNDGGTLDVFGWK
jgi:hypothetical protein